MITDDLELSKKRHFNLEEANACIPWLNHSFASVSKLRAAMETAPVSQLEDLQQDIDGLLDALVSEGIEVVDLDLGIVNFYAWDDDEEVVLSWQFGETSIHYWHEPFEDFCHRRPLKLITSEAPKSGPAIH